ncbi:hypothetical protein E2542_SST23159 [Spatholobus suberectus]|nr:hypothetical protein E2542_SST23159 [Spatholobus suberectus]
MKDYHVGDIKALSSSGKVEEEVICSSSVEAVGSGLEEEETCTHKASCVVVVEESGKLGLEHEEGRCELVVEGMGICMASCVGVESGTLGEGEGNGACALEVGEMGTCMASYEVVVVGSGRLGQGEGEGVGVGVGEGEGVGAGICALEGVGMGTCRASLVVVVVMGSGKGPLEEVVRGLVVVEMGSGKASWVVEEERGRCSGLLKVQMGG